MWAESPVSGVLEEDKSSMVNKKNYYLATDRWTVRNWWLVFLNYITEYRISSLLVYRHWAHDIYIKS